jgi:hypothetical protein
VIQSTRGSAASAMKQGVREGNRARRDRRHRDRVVQGTEGDSRAAWAVADNGGHVNRHSVLE